MTEIIQINHLKKSFKNVEAVKDLTFKVKTGELFAFLGVNGAGKSTTISIICGQLKKDFGEVIINGINIDDNLENIKSDLGVVFQYSVLDKSLTVIENLQFKAALYGIVGSKFEKKLDELCEIFDLKSLLNRPVGKLSGGQRRRVDIARALLHDPKILILDEPTTGLDPQTRQMIWHVIEVLRKEKNITVFLTTHYMEEAATADYIVIIDGGLIIAQGTTNELKNKYVKDYLYVYNVDEEKIIDLKIPYDKVSEGYKIEIENTSFATKLIIENRDVFTDYEVIKGKMDDVFLTVTGKALSDGDIK